MRQEISYCAKCLDQLENYGEMAAESYKEICMHYSLGNAVHCLGKKMGHGEVIVRFLEIKGYVVTREADKRDLWVKPTGYQRKFRGYAYDHSFCAGHQNEIEIKREED